MNRISRLAVALFLIVFLGACRLFDGSLPGGLPNDGRSPTAVETDAAVSTPSAPTQAPVTQPAVTLPPANNPQGVVLLERGVMEESQNPRYEIDALWPELEWGSDPRVDAFNQASEAIAQEEIATFKQGVANTPNDPAFQEFSSSLQIRHSPTYQDNGLFSVRINVSFYMAGAAHPAHYSHAINYNLQQGKLLTLEELFQPGSPYLEILSTICLEDLQARGVLAWEEGALPKAENFQDWNLTPSGVQITFDEYRVAPYAAGPQAVLIPYERLEDEINPEGPLAGLIQ